ncbi:sensor histidine kinase [Ferruginibacter sp. SUN106]|uniref:sensor histidine kinase n=1 Tax=Ferruginibacter sp. SUN106 TaxID=2978348 RepID=UPI003D3654C2
MQQFNFIRNQLENSNNTSDNIDSSLCIQLLSIAQHLKNDSLLAISYNWIGAYFAFSKGDNISGLEYFFKGIPLAEKAKDKRRISSLYFDISLVYSGFKNYKAEYDYTIKGGENLPDQSSLLYNFMLIQYQNNLCGYYLDINKADSALYYARLGTETSGKIGIGMYDMASICLTGAAYALANDTANADSAFTKALTILPNVKLSSLRSLFYDTYIKYLIKVSRLQQAELFCRQFINLGNTSNSNAIRLMAVVYMQQLFDALHQTDSAYYYSRQESKINAAIFSEGNINRLQALSFHEKLRNIEAIEEQTAYKNQMKEYILAVCLFFFIVIGIFLYRNNRQKHNANMLLQEQKQKVENTLNELKSTQSQLIQSEKMASLGELTAGIAHEIQNPLNFVNNFSEVSNELIDEMKEELSKGNYDDAKDIADDVKQNLEKINHHGKRADAIVKGMLQHSQSSSGKKEPTDINKLADEYLRLAYHGLRAKDNSFNATLKTDFDETIGNVNIIPQDMGRVLLNLITNAFYAVQEKSGLKDLTSLYEPAVSINTKRAGDKVLISVTDNGNGIAKNIVDKIFQPFFTTKPTGQGTGLGLSLAYDIVKAHGGELIADTTEGNGTTFTIKLPI